MTCSPLYKHPTKGSARSLDARRINGGRDKWRSCLETSVVPTHRPRSGRTGRGPADDSPVLRELHWPFRPGRHGYAFVSLKRGYFRVAVRRALATPKGRVTPWITVGRRSGMGAGTSSKARSSRPGGHDHDDCDVAEGKYDEMVGRIKTRHRRTGASHPRSFEHAVGGRHAVDNPHHPGDHRSRLVHPRLPASGRLTPRSRLGRFHEPAQLA